MTIRTLRLVAPLVAALLAALALVPAAAQESSPAAASEGDQPVMVGTTEVTWTGDWSYDEQSSMDDQQVSLIYLDSDEGTFRVATYGEFEAEDVESPEEAIENFMASYLEDLTVGLVTETGRGELEDGTLWRVLTFDLNGNVDTSVLFTISETPQGTYVVSTVAATAARFQEAVELAQQEILLNGEPLFLAGVDPVAISADLRATPAASPAATPAT